MSNHEPPSEQDVPALTSLEEPRVAANAGPPGPRLSPVVTILATAVLLTCLALFAWLEAAVPRLDRLEAPERALAHMVGREMDMEDALARAPAWQGSLYVVATGGSSTEAARAIAWYEELAAHSPDPVVQLHLAILEAEAGHLDQVRVRVQQWSRRSDPYPGFARLVQSGYLGPQPDPAAHLTLQAELAEALPAGWFYDQLAESLATRAGPQALRVPTDQAQAARGATLLRRAWGLIAIELGVLVIGLVALGFLARQRAEPDGLRIGPASVPPRWSGWVGVAVLVRGGAVGALLMVGFLVVGADNLVVRLIAIPVTNLPLLLLARRHLLEPAGLGWLEALGLRPVRGGWGRLALAVPAILAVGLLGEWVIGLGGESLNVSSHWTEWFDADLVWGSGPVLAVSLLEYVLFAPIFEEIVFRGLLFATLRRRFGWGVSASVSAAIFALAHGYGLVGLVSVLWSGLLWAWAYEKTGSMLPGMAAHALNNLSVCLTVIAMLRW